MSDALTCAAEPAESIAATASPREYRIPESAMAKLRDGFDKLAKRAEKLGVAAPSFTELRVEKEVECKPWNTPSIGNDPKQLTFWALENAVGPDDRLTGRFRLFHVITVTGATPKLAGWRLIAVIEHLPGESNLLRKVPTVADDLPNEYRDAEPTCDHCRLHRYRKETFVVRHDDGRWARVGRDCLSDFLGGVSPEHIAAVAELLLYAGALCDDASEWRELGGSRFDGYLMRHFTAMTSACIREFGWTSRKNAYEYGKRSTADDVLEQLHPPSPRPWRWVEVTPTDDDNVFADAAVDWAATLDETMTRPLTDYEHNLNVLAKHKLVLYKHAGLAASLPNAYRRHLNILEEHKRAASMYANSRHVGEIGERREFEVTVVKVIPLESRFGPKTLYTMVDADGNALKWFATGDAQLEAGETYSLIATIKKHDEYKGTKQTVLTRAKLAPSPDEVNTDAE